MNHSAECQGLYKCQPHAFVYGRRRGSDLMIANVRISHQHSHPFPGIQVWAWVCCECPELLSLCWPPNSWHGSQELKSLECQHWQHLDDGAAAESLLQGSGLTEKSRAKMSFPTIRGEGFSRWGDSAHKSRGVFIRIADVRQQCSSCPTLDPHTQCALSFC